MRVITGKYKGRILVAPKDDARPTLDRTKETLFNIINPLLDGAKVLDLFAGSGQLAIEALSRGAYIAVLSDNSRLAIDAIKTNFAKIGLNPDVRLCNYSDCLLSLSDGNVDIAFVDPPYKSDYYLDVLTKIDNYNVLSSDGIVICEHSADDLIPQVVGTLQQYDCRKIGSVKFSFYKRS